MACILEIRKTIQKSIDEKLSLSSNVGIVKRGAEKIRDYLNDLWDSPIAVVKRNKFNSNAYVVEIKSLDAAVNKEFKKQLAAEKSFKRDLAFFNYDSQLFIQEQEIYTEPINDIEKIKLQDISFLGKLEGEQVTTEKGAIGVNKQQLMMLLGSTMYNKPLAQVAVKELLQNSFDGIKAMHNLKKKNNEVNPLSLSEYEIKFNTPFSDKMLLEQEKEKYKEELDFDYNAYIDDFYKEKLDLEKNDFNIKPGSIKLGINMKERTISIKDDGIGMTPDIVKNAFLSIGGTNKEGLSAGERSGGLGLAKVQFLMGSESIKVITVKNGTKTTIEATNIQLYNDDFEIQTEQTNENNGTFVEVKIPKDYKTIEGTTRAIDFPGSYGEWRSYDILKKPLIGNVDVNVNFTNSYGTSKIESVPIGINSTKETLPPFFSKITFNWGEADVYMSEEKSESPKHQVLSSGIYQFETNFRDPNNYERIKYNIVVNIKPSVISTSEQYPFNNQREGFKNTVENDIKSLNSYLLKYARGESEKEAVDVFSDIKPLPQIDPNKILTPEERTKLYEQVEKTIADNKKAKESSVNNSQVEEIWRNISISSGIITNKQTGETKTEKQYASSFDSDRQISDVAPVNTEFFNPKFPQYHNNTNFDYLKVPGAIEFITDFGNTVLQMVNFAGDELGYRYKKLESNSEQKFFAGVSIDKTYGGVHIRKIINAIFVNPLSFDVSNLEEAVGVALHITIHEINHTTASGEGANFTTDLATLYGKIYATGKYSLYEGLFRSVYKKHFETFNTLKNEYDKSSTKNLSRSFEGNEIKRSNQGINESNVENVSTGQSSKGGYNGDTKNIETDKLGDVIASQLSKNKKVLNSSSLQTQQEPEVKPGVSELFDSNPELANAVYEALGFNDNNFELKENKEAFGKEPHPEGATTYDIFSNDRKIGKIALFDSKNPMIKGLNLNEPERNKGLGKALYKWLNYKAILKGGKLYADQEFISPDAQRVWESLNKEGLVDLTGNSPKFNDKQKQQVQQQYSQYLDSIFPDSQVKDIVYHGTDAQFEKFDKSLIGKESIKTGELGIFFSDDKEVIEQSFSPKRIVSSILNIRIPNKLDWQTYMDNILDSPEKINKKGYDAIIGEKTEEPLFNQRDKSSEFAGNSFIVFEPEQIHILGNKQDIQGFKEFVSKRLNEIKPIQEAPPKVSKSNQTELFQIEQQKSRLKEKSLVDRANLLLNDYIKANNIKVEFLDKVLSKNGKEVVAKYDSIKRIIQINSNQASALTLPEELAHDLTLALGTDHVLVKRALNLIGRLDYKGILGQQYVDAYKGDVNLLKMELLGKLISKQIADPKLPDELKSENGVKIWETIKNAIKAFISLFKPNSNITSELDNIVSELSDIVISGKEVGNPTMSVEMFDINSTIHDVKKGFPMTNSNNQKLLSREKTFTLRTKNHASGLYKFGKNYYNVLNMYGKAVKADEIKNPDYLKKKFVGEEDVRFDHVKAFFDGTEPLYVYQITKVDDSIQAMLEEQAKSGGIPQDVEKYYVFYTRLISKLKKDVKKINNSLSDESKRIEAKIQEIEATLQNLIYNNNKQNLIDLAHKTIDDVDTYLKKLYALEQSGQDFNVKNMEKSIKVLHTFENLEEVGERARLLISSFKRFGIKLLDEEHLRLTGREITDKEKNEIQKDINYGEFQFGTLSDVRNYLGKTIGLSIKEKQSIIEKNNKESKKILDIEIKKLEDFQKTQGITGKDIYKIFIQEHRGSTVLTKPYTSDYYKLIADSFEKENGAEIRKKLSVYNSKSNNWEPKDSTYYSDNYKEIHKKGNEPLLEFYNFFKKTIADITDKLPVDELDENFIPNIVESTLLSVLKSDKESIGKLKDGVNHIMSANFWSTRENEYFINRELEKDEVPLKYIGNIPSDKKSNDLGYVLLNFMHFGNSYEQMSDLLPKVELFQELMQEKQFIVGGKRNPGSSTNLNNLIDGFIKMQVKGEMKSDNDFLGKAAPIIDFALTYTSLLRIGFSPFAAAANFAVGGTGNIIEAMGGRYFNMANLSEANTIFLAQSFNEDSKLSNIIKKVNPLVEIDDFLNLEEVQKGTDSYAKKLKSASYFLQRVGEQKLQVSVMIAIMLNNKVTTKNGDKISMWEAFDENGVWDEKLMGYEFLEIDLNKLTNKVQAVNQGIHGRYSSKDAAIFAQQSLFRAVYQFKKWIPAAIESRFGGKKPSERLGVETEGRYRSYLKGFKYLWANVKGDIKSIEENKFTELDIYSMRKNLTELLIVTVLLLARAGFEDDKLRKKPAYKFTMNLLNQVSGDLLFFYDPINMQKSFTRIPIERTLKDFSNIFINIPAIFDDGSKSDKKKYHYRSGPNKGENKFSGSVKNFIPGVKPVFDIYRLGNGSPAKK